MKRIIALLIFLVPLLSQSQLTYSGGTGHFAVGVTYLNFKSVNAFMQTQQMPAFGSNCLSIGGGGFGVYNNFILGGEGSAIAPSRVSSGENRAALAVGYGMIQGGYILPLESRLVVYPILGMGWGGSDLKISNSDGGKQTYNSVKVFLNTEINLDMFMKGTKYGSKAGFKYGLALGYMYNPFTESWTDENGKGANISNSYLNGFYIKLKIGGGGLIVQD
ncbi:MAG: hypothetical protein ACXVNM_07810 [Bacteroidia bacterium]